MISNLLTKAGGSMIFFMVPKFSLALEEKDQVVFDYFALCGFKLNGETLEIVEPDLILGEYLYFEAIQELIGSAIICLSQSADSEEKKGSNGGCARKKEEPLKRALRQAEEFQAAFFVALFKDLFASCRGLPSMPVAPCQIESLGRLWDLVSGERLDPPIDKEEALSLKAYFSNFDPDGEYIEKAQEDWKEIVSLWRDSVAEAIKA